MEPIPVDFRLAREADIPDILAMMERFYAFFGDPFRPETEANLFDFLRHPEYGRLWLVHPHREALRPIGYLVLAFGFSFEFGGRDAFLDELWLEEPWRGKGLGRQALDFLTDQAKALGIHAIHLEVLPHNEQALKLYQSYGFQLHERYLMTRWINFEKV